MEARFVLVLIVLSPALAGCLQATDDLTPAALPGAEGLSLVRFDRYHLSADHAEALLALEEAYPHLVDIHEIGRSVLGRPILLATVTNEALRTAPGGASGDASDGRRPIAFVDGCHHGNEIQGCEAPLFLAQFLAQNYATNAAVREILDAYEIHVVPVVNPDGRDLMTRVNANGINLNRNYPTDHGNPLGLSYPLGPPVTPHTWRLPSPWVPGPIAEQIPGAVPFQRPVRPSENGGFAPMDQPETRAVHNWLVSIREDLALYVTYHTATHSVVVPWAAMNAPFEMPAEHDRVLQASLDWINAHTTYAGGRIGWGDSSGNLSYAASGSSMDWGYHGFGVPSFTVETYVPTSVREQWPDDVNFWGDSSLVFSLWFVANAGNFAEWKEPTAAFPYPAEWTGVHWFPEGAGQEARRTNGHAWPEL